MLFRNHMIMRRAAAPLVRRALSGQGGAATEVPESCEVLVVGGGIIGVSVAYNLAKRGVSDVVLLERHKLTSGTTWHAAGLVGQLRATKIETELSAEAVHVYRALEEETGLSTGFKQCGSLTTAATRERFEVVKRNAARARSYGLEAEVLTAEECGAVMTHDGHCVIRTEDLYGGLWLPGDGSGSPTDLTMAFAKGARMRGATLLEGVVVDGFQLASIDQGRKRVLGVTLEDGRQVKADKVVLCAGQWSRDVARRAGVTVPLHSCEHFYATTAKLPGVHPNMPVFRDNDSYSYVREWGEGLLVGGFEANAKPIWTRGVPDDFAFGLLEDDLDHFTSSIWEGASHRVPALDDADITAFVNGPESFTPDNQYILGEAPEVANFFVAAGLNSAGIANAAGVGLTLSEWIVDGRPSRDVWGVDIRRFGAFHRAPEFLRDRCAEVLGLHYAMPWPRKELESARNLRLTALHGVHEANGAQFGQKFGWERVNYFAPGDAAVAEAHTIDAPPAWLGYARAEHAHCRENVALFDVSSFAKLLVSGEDAEACMQRLCCGDVSEVHTATYTGMLNEAGGYESDVTVTKLDASSFLVVAPTGQATRDADWIRRHLSGRDATVVDVSNQIAVLAVMGPQSRALLRACVADPAALDDDAFPFGASREIDVGHATCRAQRITYVGELGYELYVPVESAAHVYRSLHAASHAHATADLRDGGYYAIDRAGKG